MKVLAALLVASALLQVASVIAAPADHPCPARWLGVQAMVTRINPPRAVVLRRAAGAQELTPLALGSVLCEGDSLEFSAPTRPAKVDLYQAGKVVTIESRDALYRIPSGARARVSAAAAYVSAVMEGVDQLGVPPARPEPTRTRAAPIRAIKPLRGLPRQDLTVRATALLGWLDGTPPYECQIVDADDKLLFAGPQVNTDQCKVTLDDVRSARLLVRDKHRSVGWSIAVVGSDKVPRPPWLTHAGTMASDTDTMAWGLWLWQEGGPAWRLQSLAMLQAAASTQWLAQYFVDSVLGEVPLTKPP